MFQYLIQSHDEAQMAKEQLRLAKTRRFFRVLLWNRDNSQQYQAAHDIIECKQQAQTKYKFFFQWRARLIKQQLVQAFIKNKQTAKSLQVLQYLAYHTETCQKLKQHLLLKSHERKEKTFSGLRRHYALKQIKKAQMELSITHFDKSLVFKAFGVL